MAVDTLFNESYDKLLMRARVETASDPQSVALIEMSVLDVRTGFFDKLGADRVNEILTYPYSELPVTEEELTRTKAANIEAIWLTYLLMQRLPYNMMSAFYKTNQIWNEEPLTRDVEKDMLEVLKGQIDAGLADLAPGEYDSDQVRSSSVGPDEPIFIRDLFPAGER
jgi:hypothetical protein